ncbi:MAG: 8-oxoguanine deaminase [Deltaproteobacteria bacterium]|nr:8-oxoguanine deaminase [Deltaproteobacteria bacterium]
MSSDLLLKNIYHLVSRPGQDARLRGVDLLVSGGIVKQIGEQIDAPAARVIDASTKLVFPGLVNTHHHMYQSMTRCLPAVQNAELFDWLVGLYPVWSKLGQEALEVATQLCCAELLKSGCTATFDHHYLFSPSLPSEALAAQVSAATATGIRFCVSRGSMSRGKSQGGLPPDSVVQDEQEILEASERLIAEHHDADANSMVRVALAPCSPFSVTDRLMERSAELARRYGVKLHTHLAETADEERYCQQTYGCRPLALMERLGWLGEDVWFAHGVHFDDAELDQLAATRTGIAHCPTSNMRLGSGFARVTEMIGRGVRVGLAVDGCASNDSSNMLAELRNCLLLHRVKHGAAAIDVHQVFDLATRGSADLLGWSELGTLEVGKPADLVLVEMDRLDYVGALSDPLAAVVFCGLSQEVHSVIVNGRLVVDDGRLTAIDEQALRREGNRQARALLERAGVETRWYLDV